MKSSWVHFQHCMNTLKKGIDFVDLLDWFIQFWYWFGTYCCYLETSVLLKFDLSMDKRKFICFSLKLERKDSSINLFFFSYIIIIHASLFQYFSYSNSKNQTLEEDLICKSYLVDAIYKEGTPHLNTIKSTERRRERHHSPLYSKHFRCHNISDGFKIYQRNRLSMSIRWMMICHDRWVQVHERYLAFYFDSINHCSITTIVVSININWTIHMCAAECKKKWNHSAGECFDICTWWCQSVWQWLYFFYWKTLFLVFVLTFFLCNRIRYILKFDV